MLEKSGLGLDDTLPRLRRDRRPTRCSGPPASTCGACSGCWSRACPSRHGPHHRRGHRRQPVPGDPRGAVGPAGPRTAGRCRPCSGPCRRLGGISDEEMFRTFNMGVGYVLVVPAAGGGAGRRAAERGRGRGRSVWARSSRGPSGWCWTGCRERQAARRSPAARRAPRRGARPRRRDPPVFRLAVLASGSGTNLQAIIDQLHRRRPCRPERRAGARPARRARRARRLSGAVVIEVALVVSDVPGARALERARAAGIPTAVLPGRATTPPARSTTWPWSPPSREREADLVVLAGYMRLVSPEFVRAFPWRIINLHPALLPAFPGHHLHQRRRALRGQGHRSDRALRGRGAGHRARSSPRKPVRVEEGDTPESLAARIHAVEHELLPATIRLIAAGRVQAASSGNPGRPGRLETAETDVTSDEIAMARPAGPGGERGGESEGQAGAGVGLGQERSRAVRAGAGGAGGGGHLHRRDRPLTCGRRGCPSPASPRSPAFPRSWTGGSRRCIRPSTAASSPTGTGPAHLKAIADLGIKPIDLVVVNLYPFEATVAQRGVTEADAVENIDIGGPSMVRVGGQELLRGGDRHRSRPTTTPCWRSSRRTRASCRGRPGASLAAKAFHHTAHYDSAIASWFGEQEADFPEHLMLDLVKLKDLRYGENPHQRASWYSEVRPGRRPGGGAGAAPRAAALVQQPARPGFGPAGAGRVRPAVPA